MEIGVSAYMVSDPYFPACHPRESGGPENPEFLDSRFRGNDIHAILPYILYLP
jgi:hypothetical protein